MLTEAPACTRFRLAIIDIALESRCRIVHMPGIDLDILAASTNIPFREASGLATTYRDVLSRGKKVEIITRDQTGKEHRLAFSVAGREGHADGGVVGPGEIINFPTGEAYIAPVEDSAHGSIVINGSIPDAVLGNREIVLYFQEGRMIPTQTIGTAEQQIRELLRSLEETSRSDGGNSYCLGEFGIGCNPGYTKLTGRQVVDEKVAGTVHIALGENKVFGGNVRADTHLDLVLYPTSVLVDDETIALPEGGAK